ncbi:MAG: PEGA domain-containing protein [Verrucomicrobiales bacterium]|nr:PEGA domain-containing protein [Verrucomicrobiales bacterium]
MSLPKLFIPITALIWIGCATNPSAAPRERGPQGTVAYEVSVESEPTGARIEVNQDFGGKTPLVIQVFGDKDGTFHNFGRFNYTITAFPLKAGQSPQTKEFRTGAWFTPEDRIPKQVFFDFGSQE